MPTIKEIIGLHTKCLCLFQFSDPEHTHTENIFEIVFVFYITISVTPSLNCCIILLLKNIPKCDSFCYLRASLMPQMMKNLCCAKETQG